MLSDKLLRYLFKVIDKRVRQPPRSQCFRGPNSGYARYRFAKHDTLGISVQCFDLMPCHGSNNPRGGYSMYGQQPSGADSRFGS